MGSDHAALMEAIKLQQGCDSTHVETVHVLERTDGRTLWEGDVQVFELLNHPKATRCYAWATLRESQYVVILHSEKVHSPRLAVMSRLILGSKRHD